MNTKITYLYRDADNYKMENQCVISGELSRKQIKKILKCCDLGEYFIPLQVGLPEKRFEKYDPKVDHCWFELSEDSFEKTNQIPTIALSAEELVQCFTQCSMNWNDQDPQLRGMEGPSL